MAFADYQLEIYFQGLSGVLPALPMAFAELEAKAEAAMSPSMWSYVAGGSGDERTQRVNVTAFDGWGLMPRMFVGANDRDLSVDLFGMTLPSPVMMAPVGVIGLCAQDGHGDLATARAAARTGVPMIASTLSADPMEQVAAEFGDTPGFFQLYTPTDRDLAASLVHRAEAAGFKGIVVTLDTWLPGWRPRDLSTSNFPFLRGHCLSQLHQRPGLPRQPARTARGEPAGRSHALDPDLRKSTDVGRPALAAVADQAALDRQGHLSPRRRAARRSTAASTASTAPTTAAVRPTAAYPRSTACPASSKPQTDFRCCSTRASAAASTSSRQWRLAPTAVAIGRPYAYGLALGGVDGIVHVLAVTAGRGRRDAWPSTDIDR